MVTSTYLDAPFLDDLMTESETAFYNSQFSHAGNLYSRLPFNINTFSKDPIDTGEIKRGLDAEDFTIDTIVARGKKNGDLFKGVLDADIAKRNTTILKKLLIN